MRLIVEYSCNRNGKKGFQFSIKGWSNSDNAKCLNTRKNITRCRTFLNAFPAIFRSSTQKTLSLSTTETENTARVTCTHDMISIIWIIQFLWLNVETQMVLELDNEGAADLASNWGV